MSDPHAERLARLDSQGKRFHLLPADASDAFDMARSLSVEDGAKTVARVVRGKKCRTTRSLFDEFAAAWQFPPYFGENWNAFIDCLSDLDWIEADTYLVMIVDAHHLLADEGTASLRHLVDALDTVAKRWATPTGEGYRFASFHVIFQADPADKPALAARLMEAGAAFDVI
jgi:hypothetical protein